jgi:4-hydroxy-2-oxoheptanedioate aldolase
MLEQTVKQRIHAGETVIGVGVSYKSDRAALQAIFDRHPYDFIHCDVQHGPYNEEAVQALCAAADTLGVPVVMRIKHARDAYLIGNYLDLGLSGVELPQVEHEATVKEAIAGMFFPPTGRRSWGEPRTGPGIPTSRVEHAHWFDSYGLLFLQIESILGVTDARRLAKPGVACLTFGPNDLNFDIETYPSHPLNTVDKCVQHVAEQLRGTGVALCFRTTPATRPQYADMGVTVFIEAPAAAG